jgi:hypothetical protein
VSSHISLSKDSCLIEVMMSFPAVDEAVRDKEKLIARFHTLLEQIAVQTDSKWAQKLADDEMRLWDVTGKFRK